MEVMRCEWKSGEFGIGDRHALRIPVRVVVGLDGESGGGGGRRRDELDDGAQRGEVLRDGISSNL